MRRVYIAENAFDACLVRDRLLDAGIEAAVHGEMLVGAIGELPPDSRPAVWIADDALYDRAREVVEQFERGEPAGRRWRCRRCGEENEGTFALCWNCTQPSS